MINRKEGLETFLLSHFSALFKIIFAQVYNIPKIYNIDG